MNIFALSSVFNSKIYPEKSDNKIQQQLFATKPDSVSFGAKKEADIQWEWLGYGQGIRDIVEKLLAKDNSTKTMSMADFIKVYRYFGYDIPSGGTKKGNKGSSGSGDDHGYKHSAFDIYVTVQGKENEVNNSAVTRLKNALRMINQTNGELLPQPNNENGGKITVDDDMLKTFIEQTSEYDAEKNTNQYRAKL